MTVRRAILQRLGLTLLVAAATLWGLWQTCIQARAWSEEPELYFYEPLATPRTVYTTNEVSSIHFDLVGALAIAAGFSVTDAATIQIYSQLTDPGVMTGTQVYAFQAASLPSAPPIATVMTSTFCPSPSTTGQQVSMGSTKLMECPGCFTSRYGPYGVFFHMPHDRPDELGALRAWAFATAPELTGVATFGYSSTVDFIWLNVANVYATTPCFVTTTQAVDTGGIAPGSLEALGVYLHSLGDHWSHGACIAAADAAGKPFAAHVAVPPNDPLAPCRWLMHQAEFGNAQLFPGSNRTFSGTLALYNALVDYAGQSDRPIYRPIPLMAEDSHIYNALYEFVHTATAENPAPRRRSADELRAWAAHTRATNPRYWPGRLYLPLVMR